MAIVIDGENTTAAEASTRTNCLNLVFVSEIILLAACASLYEPLPAFTAPSLFILSIATYTLSGFGKVVAALSR